MKRYLNRSIRWSDEQWQEIGKFALYGKSEFIRDATMKEVARLKRQAKKEGKS